MDEQRPDSRPYARRRTRARASGRFPWRVLPRLENTHGDRIGGARHRLRPGTGTEAALMLATAAVIGIFLANPVAGVIAMVLLAAGGAIAWHRRNR